MSAFAFRSLAVAAALGASAALFAETRHYGLVGFDTYPLIETSRVASWADAVGLLSERLMDGRYPSGFHRPVTSASFALDYAIWGLAPVGYQLTGALVFGAILVALHAIGWELGGRRPSLMALAIPALFALHPSFYEIVPIPARRADLLCCAFGAVAIVCALRARMGLAALATALAIGSKEPGYAFAAVAVGVSMLSALARAGGAGRAQALRRSLLQSWPVACAALAMLAMRVAVLGGLGGHGGTSLSQTASATPRVALDLILGVAIPDTGGPRLVAAVGVALGLLLAVVSALLVRGRPSAAGGGAANPPNPPNPPNWLGVAVGASCIAMLALTYAGVGWIGAWYYMLPALGWAIALAALFAALLRNVRGADGESAKARAAAAGALALLLGSSIGHARLTPYFHRYGEWQRATAVADDFLQELSARIVRASPGDRIDGPPLPMWVAPREGIPHVRGAAVLSDYSVQAWAHLVHPDRRVRVLGVSEGVLPTGPPTAAAGEIVVALPRRMVGY